MCHRIADEDDPHIFLCISDGVFARPEELEYRVEEQERHRHEEQSDHHVEDDHIAEHLVGCLVVPLSEQYGYHSCRSDSHQGAERRRKVHQRERHRQSGDGQRTYALTYEYAVYDVVQGRRRHGYDGRDGIVLKELSYRLRAELYGYRFLSRHRHSSGFSVNSISNIRGAYAGIRLPLPEYPYPKSE